ncbi:MAG: hypothetical protein WC045_01330 [Patescibacteria group bacterium]
MKFFPFLYWLVSCFKIRPTVKKADPFLQELGNRLLIVVFAFGQVEKKSHIGTPVYTRIFPGESNEALAEYVKDLWTQYPNAHFAIQWKVCDWITGEMNLKARITRIHQHREVDPKTGKPKYLDCQEIALQANDAHTALLTEVQHTSMVVSHEILVPRGVALMQNLEYTAHVPPGLGQIPYCKDSTQPWCRSKWRFVPREILARILYRLKGWI